jgi:hypothetical protein
MYAAGHPPLSGFEIESFADKMPRHWRYSNELRSENEANAATFERTRNILIGGVVSVRMAIELAMADAAAPLSAGRWPELARLDCFACHHELVEPSWRQLRSAATTPGRPQLAVGCIPLVKIAAALADDPAAESVDAMLLRLRQPFADNVFGDRQMLVDQGTAAVAWCRELEKRLQRMNFEGVKGGEAARTVLRSLAERAAAEPCDYDTARQLYGAWVVIYGELVANKSMRLSDANQRELDSQLARINRNDPFVLQRDRIKPPCEVPAETDQSALGEQLEEEVRNAVTTRTR